MVHTRREGLRVAILAAIVVVVLTQGCSARPKEQQLQPKVFPPAIREAGTLTVGVDTSYPPFGGTDAGQQAGLDLDAAAALAERLGLKLAVVPVKASQAATALADGSADVVMSVPFSAEAVSNVSLAGSYVSDAPGFFVASDATSSAPPTVTIQDLPQLPERIGVQKGSPAYWKLRQVLDPQRVKDYPTLRDALDDLTKGAIPVVAGDAAVGAYIARDFPRIQFAGQLQPAVLLGVAVSPNNPTLGDLVRSALDGLAADGVFDAIRAKWLGDLPGLEVARSSSTASETSSPATP